MGDASSFLFNILINNVDKDTGGMLIKFGDDVKLRVIANMLDVHQDLEC